MANDYKDICNSISKLEKAVSDLPRDFSSKSNTKYIVRSLEQQLKEFKKSNIIDIRREISNSKQFKMMILMTATSVVISFISLFK